MRSHLFRYGFIALLLGFFSTEIMSAQSITMSPGYSVVGVNGTIQYSAVVNGLTNKTLTWWVSGVKGGNSNLGTVSTAGLYTAPAQAPLGALIVAAVASDNRTVAAQYVVVQAGGPTVNSISPNPLTIGNYTATLTGSGFVSGANVLIGGYSFPATVVNSTTIKVYGFQPTTGTVNVQVMNPGTLWGAAIPVTFKTATPQTISPQYPTVAVNASQQFTSTGAISWTASAGSVSSSGLFTAPSTAGNVTVTCTGTNGSASAVVTVFAPQTISPISASMSLGATQQFISPGATSWAVSAGSITSAGLFTAPSALPSSQSVQVTATGSAGLATAVVTLVPPSPIILSAATAQLPLGTFTTTLTGTGFIGQSVAMLNGVALATTYTNGALSISGFAAQSGVNQLVVSNGNAISPSFPIQVGAPNPKASSAAARRFLEQGAFGPTPSEADHVQSVGLKGWLTEQMAMPQVSNYSSITGSQGGLSVHFLTMAVTNQDQLRQRVAFALSQIFVTSADKLIWNMTMIPYQNMLLADSFSNFRQIMEDVTLSPAMGLYLDMANNAKADTSIGSLANENFARELMQLFTIGTNMLNSDGSVQLDASGLPIPTYSQFTVTEFARVYTGWTFAPPSGSPVQWGVYQTANGNLAPYPAMHDAGSKQLLNGYTSPAGLSPQQDLDNALDNIFNHPNVGPFVTRQLIQHLVKSNPSPSYIARVTAVFNNNGQNVRGDMQAVINAILLDPEARANDEGGKDQAGDGHLQEPALFLAGMFRAFGGQMSDDSYYRDELTAMGQNVFDAPSVFNYYAPTYGVPGSALTGGEFQIYTPNTAIVRANEVSTLFSQYSNPVQNYGPGTTVDLTAFVPLASNPAALVNALDLTLTHGVMPAAMKSQIVTAVSSDTAGNLHQVETACYLILTSSYYNVWH